VAAVYCWRSALVTLATIPLVALGGAMYQKIALATGEEDAEAYIEATEHASTVIQHVRLVTSMGRSQHMLDHYDLVSLGSNDVVVSV